MEILWASPLPPMRTGVSDYAVELLGELGRHAAVRVVSPPDWSIPEDWPLGNRCTVVPTATRPRQGEVQLVHLGNNPHHLWLIARLEHERTAVVLHDLVLHHLLVESTLAVGDEKRYLRSLNEAHPSAAAGLAAARRLGITGRRDPFLFPARRSFLNGRTPAIVHSRWAEKALRSELPDARLARVGLAVADPGAVDRSAVRAALGIEPKTVVLMHLGFLTPEKGMDELLTGLAAADRAGISLNLLIVGEGGRREALATAVSALDIEQRVSFTGWVPAADFPRLPAAADLGVALRTPSAGETSAAAIRFLACGTPVAVTGVRQFLEWPEAAAPRVTPGPAAAAEVARLLEQVASETWAERRLAARAAYEAAHRPPDVARQLIDVLSDWFSEA